MNDPKLAIDLLKQAHRLISTGQEHFICFALDHAEARTRADGAYTVATALQTWIHQKLEGYGWLGDWLAAQIGYDPEPGVRTLARMAWIDKMILSLETTGALP